MSNWEECNNESVEFIIRWLNLSPDTEMFFAEERLYMKVKTEEEERWYSSHPDDPRFTKDIVDLLKETHGADHAHLYALEKMLLAQEHDDSHGVELWRGILTALDRGKNHG